jgi:PAS domain S-box-containing protein
VSSNKPGNAAEAEEERLAALQQYHVLDTAPEQGYDDITELAAFICGTPMSLVSFVDRERQWFKAEVGLGVSETPRSQSFCAHTIGPATTLVVPDAQQDERFSSNPLVVGDPKIRFYAGAPIVEKNGHVLGTVCVIDTEPHSMSAKQISALEALARQVVVLLEQRKAIDTLERAAHDSRAADLQLQDSERRLQTFVNSLPALAWMASADGWIFWYNRRWYEYTGTTPQEMEGWGWQSVHDPKELPRVMESWSVSIATGKSFEMIFPLKGSDGEFRPFLTRIEPLRDEAGTITQWFGTNIEVDLLQKTRLALEKSEEVLNQVLTATSDAVVSVDRDWTVAYLNPRAEEIYGLSKRLVGRDLWEAFPDLATADSSALGHYTRAMNEGTAASFEIQRGEPFNRTLGVEVYPSKDGIVSFSRDITGLKHAAAALLQHEKLAAVGRLASSIAHEINNPLEAITNLTYLARTSRDLEEAIPYLNGADLELRRVSAIANQTLRFHRQATRATWVTFAELVKGILTGQHSRLTNSKVSVKERDRSSRPVLCLEGEMRQVLSNFINNAVDAMHGRGGTLYLRGRDGRDWKTGTRGMVLTVADTGTGMSDPTRRRAFEAFYTTKGIGGTGLGLWISKEIIDRRGGVLRLRSSQRASSSGTVFSLFLPQTELDRVVE